MITGPDRWYTVGAYLVASVKDGLSTPVSRYGQVPGEVAWDECCDGLLAVTVTRVFLSEEFPIETEAPFGVLCQAPYEVADFIVTVLRCVPNPSGDGAPPSAADLDASAAQLLRDISESMNALSATLCSLKTSDIISDYMVTPAEPQGPEGGCVGFNLRIPVSLERL